MDKIKLKKDKYVTVRGCYSMLLVIKCEHGVKHLFYYQKDVIGALRRMYLDRIVEAKGIYIKQDLVCPNCKRLVAIQMIFEKEKRPALRLFVGAITKSVFNP